MTDLRAAYRENWQRLAEAARSDDAVTDAKTLAATGSMAMQWAYPTGRDDGYVFYALAHMCVAYGRQSTQENRRRLRVPLLFMADLASDILAVSEPSAAPARRHRPDIDG